MWLGGTCRLMLYMNVVILRVKRQASIMNVESGKLTYTKITIRIPRAADVVMGTLCQSPHSLLRGVCVFSDA